MMPDSIRYLTVLPLQPGTEESTDLCSDFEEPAMRARIVPQSEQLCGRN